LEKTPLKSVDARAPPAPTTLLALTGGRNIKRLARAELSAPEIAVTAFDDCL